MPRPSSRARRGIEKLARMAAMAIEEALTGIGLKVSGAIPLVLCVAEPARPGRTDGLDEELPDRSAEACWASGSPAIAVVPHGRVQAPWACSRRGPGCTREGAGVVIVAGVDSLLTWPTLRVLPLRIGCSRTTNSNGFMPGEGAASVLVRQPDDGGGSLSGLWVRQRAGHARFGGAAAWGRADRGRPRTVG